MVAEKTDGRSRKLSRKVRKPLDQITKCVGISVSSGIDEHDVTNFLRQLVVVQAFLDELIARSSFREQTLNIGNQITLLKGRQNSRL